MDLKCIAAIDQNNVIGNEGGLPWVIEEDRKHYRNTISGSPVIKGRVTAENCGELTTSTDRENIVLTNQDIDSEKENVLIANSVSEALEAAEQVSEPGEEVYLLGGEEIYEQMLEYCDELIMSEIHDTFEGDTYFPEIPDYFEETERLERETFDIVHYQRTGMLNESSEELYESVI